MRHAAAGVGIGTAARAHLYRTWLTKESRKYRERMTPRSYRAHRREGARVTRAWVWPPGLTPKELLGIVLHRSEKLGVFRLSGRQCCGELGRYRCRGRL